MAIATLYLIWSDLARHLIILTYHLWQTLGLGVCQKSKCRLIRTQGWIRKAWRLVRKLVAWLCVQYLRKRCLLIRTHTHTHCLATTFWARPLSGIIGCNWSSSVFNWYIFVALAFDFEWENIANIKWVHSKVQMLLTGSVSLPLNGFRPCPQYLLVYCRVSYLRAHGKCECDGWDWVTISFLARR